MGHSLTERYGSLGALRHSSVFQGAAYTVQKGTLSTLAYSRVGAAYTVQKGTLSTLAYSRVGAAYTVQKGTLSTLAYSRVQPILYKRVL